MERVDAVKTEQKAIEILQEWLNENLTDENLNTNTVIKKCVCWCGCGETSGMKAFYEGSNKIASVAICDGCGDDDASRSDVIEIQ